MNNKNAVLSEALSLLSIKHDFLQSICYTTWFILFQSSFEGLILSIYCWKFKLVWFLCANMISEIFFAFSPPMFASNSMTVSVIKGAEYSKDKFTNYLVVNVNVFVEFAQL